MCDGVAVAPVWNILNSCCFRRKAEVIAPRHKNHARFMHSTESRAKWYCTLPVPYRYHIYTCEPQTTDAPWLNWTDRSCDKHERISTCPPTTWYEHPIDSQIKAKKKQNRITSRNKGARIAVPTPSVATDHHVHSQGITGINLPLLDVFVGIGNIFQKVARSRGRRTYSRWRRHSSWDASIIAATKQIMPYWNRRKSDIYSQA